jgi:hypothetical protein
MRTSNNITNRNMYKVPVCEDLLIITLIVFCLVLLMNFGAMDAGYRSQNINKFSSICPVRTCVSTDISPQMFNNNKSVKKV